MATVWACVSGPPVDVLIFPLHELLNSSGDDTARKAIAQQRTQFLASSRSHRLLTQQALRQAEDAEQLPSQAIAVQHTPVRLGFS